MLHIFRSQFSSDWLIGLNIPGYIFMMTSACGLTGKSKCIFSYLMRVKKKIMSIDQSRPKDETVSNPHWGVLERGGVFGTFPF